MCFALFRILRNVIFLLAMMLLSLSIAICPHQFRVLDIGSISDIGMNNGKQLWSLLEDTKQCEEQLLMADEEARNATEGGTPMEACEPEFLDLNLVPQSMFPMGKNILPYVQLNFTITSRSPFPIDVLFFRFRCIYAPASQDDYLCHNHSIQLAKWGRMIWPCRQLKIGPEVARFHFTYTCYHLFSLSQYSLEVLVRRREGGFCSRTFLLTSPSDRQLDPKIAHFYTGNGLTDDTIFQRHPPLDWSPLIALDTSFNDSLLVHLQPTEWLLQNQRRALSLSVFSVPSTSGNSTSSSFSPQQHPQLLFTQLISPSSPSSLDDSRAGLNISGNQSQFRWRWWDVDAGTYLLYAHLERSDCALTCSDEGKAEKECTRCPHTALNFTLEEPKHSPEGRRRRLMIAVAKHAAMTFFVILTLLFVALLAAFLYLRVWRPRLFARLPPRAVELQGRPNVLVLYTDDCQEHCDAVLALCQTLEDSANARCWLDVREFEANPTVRPSIWLAAKLAECDFVLVLFSACSPRVLAGERLAQRRHFPDLFNTALGFVVARINEIAHTEGVTLPSQQLQNGGHSKSGGSEPIRDPNPNIANGGQTQQRFENRSTQPSATSNRSQLTHFVFARFSYSPPSVIPPFFASSQFGPGHGGPLVLPDNIGQLIARLHGVLDYSISSSSNQRFLHEANLDALNRAMEEFRRFEAENAGWMEHRFVRKMKDDEQETDKDERDEAEGVDDESPIRRMMTNRVPTTEEERKRMVERYGLLDVEEDEGSSDEERGEEEEGKKHPSTTPLPNRTAKKRYQLVVDEDEQDDDESDSQASN